MTPKCAHQGAGLKLGENDRENSMKEVIGMHENKVDQQTIEVLKELLAKAETGNLRSLIFVDKYRNGECGHGWAGRPDMQMIGEIENVKFDFFSQAYFPMEEAD